MNPEGERKGFSYGFQELDDHPGKRRVGESPLAHLALSNAIQEFRHQSCPWLGFLGPRGISLSGAATASGLGKSSREQETDPNTRLMFLLLEPNVL